MCSNCTYGRGGIGGPGGIDVRFLKGGRKETNAKGMPSHDQQSLLPTMKQGQRSQPRPSQNHAQQMVGRARDYRDWGGGGGGSQLHEDDT